MLDLCVNIFSRFLTSVDQIIISPFRSADASIIARRVKTTSTLSRMYAVCFFWGGEFVSAHARVALQGDPVQADELARVAFGPGRKDDVVQGDVALFAAQVEPIGVDQKVRQVKEFGNQFLDVGHVELGSEPPGLADRMEQPVGQIEVSALQLEELLGEGLEMDQIGADDHGP